MSYVLTTLFVAIAIYVCWSLFHTWGQAIKALDDLLNEDQGDNQ